MIVDLFDAATARSLMALMVVFTIGHSGREIPGGSPTIGIDLVELSFSTDAATSEFNGDAQRTYLTGMSMGGLGTWELALMEPKRFAAFVPISGAITQINPNRVPYLGPVVREPDP